MKKGMGTDLFHKNIDLDCVCFRSVQVQENRLFKIQSFFGIMYNGLTEAVSDKKEEEKEIKARQNSRANLRGLFVKEYKLQKS